MCAMLVSEWCFELTNIFALFRERSFQKDTIPKPGGLGSGGPQSGRSVPALSHRGARPWSPTANSWTRYESRV